MDESPKNDSDDAPERRSIAGFARKERRVTARLAEPTLRVVFSQYVILCRIWTGFAILFALGEIASNFLLAESRWAKTLFFCVVIATITYAAERVRASIVRYQNSESVGKSVHVFQDTLILLFILVVISIIFGIIHLLNVY